MSFKSHAITTTLVSLVAAAALLMASAAGAATLRVSGTFLDQRGGNLTLPVVGAQLAVDGLANVTNTDSSGPATITAVGKWWDFDLQTFNVPLVGNPLFAQLFTQLQGQGPAAALETAAVTTSASWVGKLAPGLSPQRPNAAFAFCPGATANPACATHKTTGQGAGASQGTRHGIIKYTPSSPQFGGTMRTLLQGSVALSVVVGATPKFSHQPVGGAATSQAQYTGGHYAIVGGNYFAAGPVTTGAVLSANGAIVAPGVTLPPPSGTGSPVSRVFTAFPWTAGTVYGRETLGGSIQTVTIMGYDTRTVNGRGNIQLVAGSVSSQGPGLAGIDVNTLTLSVASGQLTPALSPTGFVALGSMLLLGGGYLVRRRIS